MLTLKQPSPSQLEKSINPNRQLAKAKQKEERKKFAEQIARYGRPIGVPITQKAN